MAGLIQKRRELQLQNFREEFTVLRSSLSDAQFVLEGAQKRIQELESELREARSGSYYGSNPSSSPGADRLRLLPANIAFPPHQFLV